MSRLLSGQRSSNYASGRVPDNSNFTVPFTSHLVNGHQPISFLVLAFRLRTPIALYFMLDGRNLKDSDVVHAPNVAPASRLIVSHALKNSLHMYGRIE